MEGESPEEVPQGPPVDGALPARQPCTYGLKLADIDGVMVGCGVVVVVGCLVIGGEMDETSASVSVHFITRLRPKRHNRKVINPPTAADKHVECNTIQRGSVKDGQKPGTPVWRVRIA